MDIVGKIGKVSTSSQKITLSGRERIGNQNKNNLRAVETAAHSKVYNPKIRTIKRDRVAVLDMFDKNK